MGAAPARIRFFMAELQRRRVFSVAAGYLLIAGTGIEICYQARASLPEDTVMIVVVLALADFPPAVVLGWMYDITPHGLRRAPPLKPGELSEAQPRLPPLVYFGLVLLAVLAVVYTAGIHYLPRVLGEDWSGGTQARSPAIPAAEPSKAGIRF